MAQYTYIKSVPQLGQKPVGASHSYMEEIKSN